ncbi:shieldin complex subunit 1 isoform X3 [Anas platyrhynchos]|uniref:shieldin complex subunit 1 isoform X3 n=1 Tax=Anas platyrhynchos TaxID=8839 RepID=UPI003AF21D79
MPVPHTFHCACNVLWMPSASYICAGATKSICVGSSCHRLRVVRSELRLTNHQEGEDTEAVTSSLLLAPVPGDCSNISAIPSGPMEGKEPSPSLHSEESSVLDLPSVSVCDLAEIFQPSSSTESSEEPFRSPDSFPSPLPGESNPPSAVPAGASEKGNVRCYPEAGLCEHTEPNDASLSSAVHTMARAAASHKQQCPAGSGREEEESTPWEGGEQREEEEKGFGRRKQCHQFFSVDVFKEAQREKKKDCAESGNVWAKELVLLLWEGCPTCMCGRGHTKHGNRPRAAPPAAQVIRARGKNESRRGSGV